MKCSNCTKKAIIEVKWKRKFYCPKHFSQYFFGQIKKVFESKKYKTTKEKITKETKILVALSGGKDSNVCFYVLKKLGFNVKALHLNLGIGSFSENSLKECQKLGELLKEEILIVDLKKILGFSMEELFKKHQRKSFCKICGAVKRYLFNKFAFENGFDYVATGHNLSDTVAHGLNTLINNYFTGFKNLLPILPSQKEIKLVGRLKPLFFLTDEEIRTFAQIHKIPFLKEKCPYVADFPLVHYFKKWLNSLEEDRPGTIRRLGFAFVELAKVFEEKFEKEKKFTQCKICQYPSATKKCYFCKIISKK